MSDIQEFIEAYNYPFYLGIDPGATGGLGLVSSCGEGMAISIPTKSKARGKLKTTVPDYPKIVTLFNEIDELLYADSLFVCLEIAQVQVKGLKSAYIAARVFGHYAMWPLFLHSRGYSLVEVHPMTWKSDIGLLKWEKDDVRKLALRWFPDADIGLKEDHNKAEALMLALYLKVISNGTHPDPKSLRNPRRRSRRG